MKSFFKITATMLAVGMAATLAGCSGCVGCNNNTKNSTLTNSNWYTGTSYKGIQPSFVVSENNPTFTKEHIIYDVKLDSSSAANSSYFVEYTDGTFETEFYAKYYDWNSTDLPEGYRAGKEDKELVYYYKNTLDVRVRYTMKTGDKAQSELFHDSMVTECYFRPAGKSLQPVYSSQTIKSTSPATLQASSLESAYKQVDLVYKNFYNRNCTEVTSVKEEKGQRDIKIYGGFNKLKSTLFDNSSLYIAVRSMKLGKDFNQPVSLFSAAAGGVSSYTVSGADTQLGNEERKAISTELAKAKNKLYTFENADDEGVATIAAEIKFAGGDLTGTTQTVWYAAITNADNNSARSTMLKVSIPLSFALGTLNITLKEVVSTLWNE